MKLKNEFNDAEVEVFGDVEEMEKASIDITDMAFVFDMVSNRLYSNPKGSIVREITSNCFDAHKEAGESLPVVIKFHEIEYTRYISFIDEGVGLSPKAMNEVYNKWFKSTKRESNEFIGAFGLGSKSPLSYTEIFYIITRVDGIEYYYSYDKLNGIPTPFLISQKQTELKNGTEIRIPIVTYGDKFDFLDEIRLQLAYFDDVFVIGADNYNNEYKILDCNTFKFRDNNLYSGSMHIVLGKVSYPIDWQVLGREEISIPVGVKFDIGEISVTPSRESIRYDEDSKKLINRKIDSALSELNKYSKEDRVFETIRELEKYKKDNSELIISIKDFDISVKPRTDYRTGKTYYPISIPRVVLKGFEHIDFDICNLDLYGFINIHFPINNSINRQSYSSRSISYSSEKYLDIDRYVVFRSKGTTFTKHKNFKIVKENPDKAILIMNRREKAYSFEAYKLVKRACFLKKNRKNKGVIYTTSLTKAYRDILKAVQDYIVRNTKSYDSIVITNQDKEDYRKAIGITKYNYEGFLSYKHYKNHKEKIDFSLKDLKRGQLVIYGTKEDKELLSFVADVIPNSILGKGIIILETAKKHHKVMQDVENTIEVEEFLKSKHKVYKKVVTNLAIQKESEDRDTYKKLPEQVLEFFTEDDRKKYREGLKTIHEAFEENARNKLLAEIALNYGKENNLIDYQKVEEVRDIINTESKLCLVSLFRQDLLQFLEDKSYSESFRKYLIDNGVKSPKICLSNEQNKEVINVDKLNIEIYGKYQVNYR